MEYFTPSIQDIRVGYECECLWCCPDPRIWEKIKVTKADTETYLELSVEEVIRRIELLEIRVPYLTKEQIEAEGWKFTGKSIDIWFEKEGSFQIGSWTSYKIILHYGKNDYRMYIHAIDTGDEHYLFEGECKDINTFRYICKLLNIL